MSEPIIDAQGIHTYYGDSHILHGIDFKVHAGETVSLMGRNGMGKSTLLRSLINLTPPREGLVKINGQDAKGMPTHRIAQQGIAFVPEDRGIFPNLSVLENLQMAARPSSGEREPWTLERVLDIFPRLRERIGHMGSQLSGGEQQMLTVARALMTNPELILLDEATEGLAPLIRLEIWMVVRHIKESGIATVIVDKDLKALLGLCDRNYILNKGEVVYEGGSARLIEEPDLHIRYLGV